MAETVDGLVCTGSQFCLCTGVAQLWTLAKRPLQQHVRKCYSNRPAGKITPGGGGRRGMFNLAIAAMEMISEKTMPKAFRKADQFVPYAPLEETRYVVRCISTVKNYRIWTCGTAIPPPIADGLLFLNKQIESAASLRVLYIYISLTK
ncbi:hypothetical protein JG688_00017277 [Phytophthora aleatoria]|uniref:Uncharacterized protein n=1 Tax=Phytophthora aleatoria TaxID=2496075 RepID=A0A8J5MBV4_9STRA|nr:hypothetical protein JG688_00017277 [Phytophthora aleatoria]